MNVMLGMKWVSLAKYILYLSDRLWIQDNKMSGTLPVELTNASNLGKSAIDTGLPCVWLRNIHLMNRFHISLCSWLVLVSQQLSWIPPIRNRQVDESE